MADVSLENFVDKEIKLAREAEDEADRAEALSLNSRRPRERGLALSLLAQHLAAADLLEGL